MNQTTKSKWRYIWVLPVMALTFASIPKILSLKFMARAMEAAGLNITLPLLGFIELLCVIIFVIPKTRNIGFLLMTAYIGGIIASEWVALSGNPITGILLEIFLWTGMYFENPALFGIEQLRQDSSDPVNLPDL